MDVDYDPGRKWSVPWQWGTTGIGVNQKVYAGDANTSAIFMDPPPELVGKVNVTPEMNDIMALATMYAGGEVCSEDPEVMKKVRRRTSGRQAEVDVDGLWHGGKDGDRRRGSLGLLERGDDARPRADPDVHYGYPKEGYIVWMDQVTLLKDAKNVDNAYTFLNFIADPENAALISSFAKYANGIAGVRRLHARGHEDRAGNHGSSRVQGQGPFPEAVQRKGAGLHHRDLDRAAEVRPLVRAR